MAGRFSVEAVFRAVDRMTAPVSRMSRNVGKFAASATRDFEQLARVSGSAFSGLRFAAGAAVAALGAATATVTAMTDEIDALAKRSDRLNFPIEEFQQWEFVATQAGITQGDFQTILDKFAKTIGELKMGQGTLLQSLKRTNPAMIRQMRTVDNTATAFEMYLEVLRAQPDVHKRAAMASAAFGRSGAVVNQILAMTTAEVAALREEQIRNGVVTREQAKDAEAFGDAMDALKRATMGTLRAGMLPMLPVLTDLIKRSREWVIANREVISEKFMSSLTWIINNFGEIVTWLKRIGVAMVVFVTFTAILQTFIGVLTLVNLLVAANPITLMVLGFIALAAAVAYAIVFFDDFADTFARLGPVAQLILSPVMGLIAALKLLWTVGSAVVSGLLGDWQPMREFWEGLVGTIGNVIRMIGRAVGLVDEVNPLRLQTDQGGTNAAAVAVNALPAGNAAGVQMVSPQERVARTIEESRTTSAAELLIRDETGRGVLTQPKNNPTVIELIQSGAF